MLRRRALPAESQGNRPGRLDGIWNFEAPADRAVLLPLGRPGAVTFLRLESARHPGARRVVQFDCFGAAIADGWDEPLDTEFFLWILLGIAFYGWPVAIGIQLKGRACCIRNRPVETRLKPLPRFW